MASPPIPPSLEHLATRPFSFYPAILNIEHNEWLFRRATWSEVQVMNCRSQMELWIPRRFIGEVSRVDDPVLIVGLHPELEFKGGSVWPHQKRVIQMPVTVGATACAPEEAPERSEPAPVVGIRLEPGDKRIFKLIGGVVAGAVLLYIFAVNLNRVGDFRQRNVVFTAKDQQFLDLSGRDDYVSIVQKLGPPATNRQREVGTIQYRALGYPGRKYTVILMGDDVSSERYIGVVDENWNPIHSVELHSGGTTLSLLRSLKRF
jgi:hypothetical protein